jgi:hypothetical protein
MIIDNFKFALLFKLVFLAGATCWIISVPIHRWDGSIPTVFYMFGIVYLNYLAWQTLTSKNASKPYHRIYICWVAVFGALFLIDSVFQFNDMTSAAIFAIWIVALVIARFHYRTSTP